MDLDKWPFPLGRKKGLQCKSLIIRNSHRLCVMNCSSVSSVSGRMHHRQLSPIPPSSSHIGEDLPGQQQQQRRCQELTSHTQCLLDMQCTQIHVPSKERVIVLDGNPFNVHLKFAVAFRCWLQQFIVVVMY